MTTGQATRTGLRVLLVTDDDDFSAQVKYWLTGVEALSLTQTSVQTAIRAGLDVTRGVQAVLLDSGVNGLLQLRLYERLRPSDSVARVPVVFARSRLTAATSGFSHDLDFYLPEDAPPDHTARLIAHVLGVPIVPPAVAARLAAPASAAVAARANRVAAALPPGLLQRLGLWGVAAALIGFTFWPLIGSGPVRDVVQGPLQALTDAQAESGVLGVIRGGR